MAAALYGSISTVAKPTLNSINPILLSALTYLIIGIVITFIIKLTGHIYNPTISDLKLIVLISICGAVFGPILFFYGLTLTSASLASILINAEFIFSIILAVSILKERPSAIGYAGIVLIFIGLLITNVDFDNLSLASDNTIVGNALIIAASFFWAVDNNVSNIILKKGVTVTRIIQLKSLIGGSITMAICLCLSFSLSFKNRYRTGSKSFYFKFGWFRWFTISILKRNETSRNHKICYDFFYILNLWSNICIAIAK